MAKRRKNYKKIYKYECTLTGDVYKLTEEAKTPDDLTSIKAYYEMHPEKDDRPAVIKKELGVEETE